MTYRTLVPAMLAGITVTALLGACASSPQRPEGEVEILTTAQGAPLSGADCSVDTGAISQTVVTPAVVQLGQPRGDLRVVCNRAGYRSSEVLIRNPGGSYMPGATRVGVGVGGGTWGHSGVGISRGFGFPLAGGRSRYPAQVVVDMTPQASAAPAAAPQAVSPPPSGVPSASPQQTSPASPPTSPPTSPPSSPPSPPTSRP